MISVDIEIALVGLAAMFEPACSRRVGEPAVGRGEEPLVNPQILSDMTLRRGLGSFFFRHLLQAGLFFSVPLFLSW